jgi:hypothetical protein
MFVWRVDLASNCKSGFLEARIERTSQSVFRKVKPARWGGSVCLDGEWPA